MGKLEIGVIEVDDAAAAELRRRAAAAGRSVQEVAATIIERTLAPGTSGLSAERRDWLAEIDRIRAMTPAGVEQSDSTEILRRMRDA